MGTPSIQLSTNMHAAASRSNHSIGELARDGIEQAMIEEMVSVCWICGEAIHKKTRYEPVSKGLLEDLAGGDVSINIEAPMYGHEYEDITEGERYLTEVARRLALPEHAGVEFCSYCSEYIDDIEDESVDPPEIPVPYQFRGNQSWEVTDISPYVEYLAEVAAVYSAGYSSFLQSLLNSANTSNIDYDPGLFWWAARRRPQNIIKTERTSWVEIALRSNAHSILVGRPPEPVLTQALNIVDASRFRGVREEPLGGVALIEHYNKLDHCPACGRVPDTSSMYCQSCFYGRENCQNKKDSCGNLHPTVSGDWEYSAEVHLQCYGCGETKSPDGLTEAFWDQYEPLLDEINQLMLNRI